MTCFTPNDVFCTDRQDALCAPNRRRFDRILPAAGLRIKAGESSLHRSGTGF
jgi:hypothetical protein